MPKTLVRSFDVTIPAGTTKANPLIALTTFEPNTVKRISWRFPGGCNGQVGIQIGARAVPVVPDVAGMFMVRTGDTTGYDLSDHHSTGDWSVIGYNLGAFPHTIHVEYSLHRIEPSKPDRFLVSDVSAVLGMGES